MERLALRANVLPVLAQADHLTSKELATAKAAVRRDLATRFGAAEGFGFGVFWDEDKLEEETIDEVDEATVPQSGYQPPSPSESQQSESLATSLPFAIFAPEPGTRSRQYSWGTADVANVEHSDFALLKEAILGRLAEVSLSRNVRLTMVALEDQHSRDTV